MCVRVECGAAKDSPRVVCEISGIHTCSCALIISLFAVHPGGNIGVARV